MRARRVPAAAVVAAVVLAVAVAGCTALSIVKPPTAGGDEGSTGRVDESQLRYLSRRSDSEIRYVAGVRDFTSYTDNYEGDEVGDSYSSGSTLAMDEEHPDYVPINLQRRTPTGDEFVCEPKDWPETIMSVGYSPTPIGDSPMTRAPFGDYYTEEYEYLWKRDLPLIKRIGANTLRLWQWKYNANHTAFLDYCSSLGLRVIASFPLPLPKYERLHDPAYVEKTKNRFAEMIKTHHNHSAILYWLIGNELNTITVGPLGTSCVNDLLFWMMEDMVQIAHDIEGQANCHPVSTPLADTGAFLTQPMKDYPGFDVWSLQIYRGCTFGSLWTEISNYTTAMGKKVVITEFGIDAFDDLTYTQYQDVQANCTVSLWRDLSRHTDQAYGGSIMEWSDEWWKGVNLNGTCQHPLCDSSSPLNTPHRHGLCGYSDDSSPDHFKNEEWWGIVEFSNSDPANCVTPRRAFYALCEEWAGESCTSAVNASDLCHPPVPLPELSKKASALYFDQPACSVTGMPPHSVVVHDRRLYVDREPYSVKGVVYSPVPIDMSPGVLAIDSVAGDFFTDQYSYLFKRDLPIIAALGANTITAQLSSNFGHTEFLDACDELGIKVIAQFYLPPTTLLTNITITDLKYDFEEMLRLHMNHPAILMWQIGYQVNINFEDQISDVFYLYGLLKDSSERMEGVRRHPIIISLAPQLNLWPTVQQYDPVVDVWGIEMYSGVSFYGLFEDFWANSKGALFITSFGMDAADKAKTMVPSGYNVIGPRLKGEALQSAYVTALWAEVAENEAVCVGGAVNEYCDEWWRGDESQTGGVDCSIYTKHLKECGTVMPDLPDKFLHERYMGLLEQSLESKVTCVSPRPVFFELMATWTGKASAANETAKAFCSKFDCCADMPGIATATEVVFLCLPTVLILVALAIYGTRYYRYLHAKDSKTIVVVPGDPNDETTSLLEENFRADPPRARRDWINVYGVVQEAVLNDIAPVLESFRSDELFEQYYLPTDSYVIAGPSSGTPMSAPSRTTQWNGEWTTEPNGAGVGGDGGGGVGAFAEPQKPGLEDGPQVEHLVQLITHEFQRNSYSEDEAMDEGLARAVATVHSRLLEGYFAWLEFLNEEPCAFVSEPENHIKSMLLWLVAWEAAGNLRHCPEVLCASFHKYATSPDPDRYARLGIDTDANELDQKVRDAATDASNNNTPELNYDDFNEACWTSTDPPLVALDKLGLRSEKKQFVDPILDAPMGDGDGDDTASNAPERKNMQKSFPEHGGWTLGIIYNYYFMFHYKTIFFMAIMITVDPFIKLPIARGIDTIGVTDAILRTLSGVLHCLVLGSTLPTHLRTYVRKHVFDAALQAVEILLCFLMILSVFVSGLFDIQLSSRGLENAGLIDVQSFCVGKTDPVHYSFVYVIFRLAVTLYRCEFGTIPISLRGRVKADQSKFRVWSRVLETVFWLFTLALEFIFVRYILEPNTVQAILYLCADNVDPSMAENIIDCWAPRISIGLASYLGYIVYTNVAFVFLSVISGMLKASLFRRQGVFQTWQDITNVSVRSLIQQLLPRGTPPCTATPTYVREGWPRARNCEMALVPRVPFHQDGDPAPAVVEDVILPELTADHLDPAHLVWCAVLESLYNDDILTPDEADFLRTSFESFDTIDLRPRSEEAQRRFMFFLSSLAGFNNWGEIDVESMRSFTILVPVYDETIVFSSDQLRQRTHVDARGDGTEYRVSDLEYLVACFPDEWQNFVKRLKRLPQFEHEGIEDLTCERLLADFLHDEITVDGLEVEVRWWASLRGQTLARTVKGAFENVHALQTLLLAKSEQRDPEHLAQNHDIVRKKVQVLVSYQTYEKASTNAALREAMDILRARYPSLNLAYPIEKNNSFTSVLEVVENGRPVRKYAVKRRGRLKIGQGKAENQNHAIVFARGECLQTLDMNQENYFEEALKMYFLLEKLHVQIPKDAPNEELVSRPRHRIVGFREYVFTERLGTVGRFMGYSEYSFGTIVQRGYNMLQVRLHYGHPDIWDGYWAMNRGISKASNMVNVNEDIFAGYELVSRGETISHTEFIQVGKGRETSFHNASVFEIKLAMGAALQLLSREVYRLNQSLHIARRFSLLYASIGFYIINAIMTYSIYVFMFTLLLLDLTGHSSHQIGTLASSLAVEWFIQMGYFYAFPLLAQMVVEKGIWFGLSNFLVDLPLSTVFYIFHMRTKCFWFEHALGTGEGSWHRTGRGFGLKRQTLREIYQEFADSHFHFALTLSLFLVMYYTMNVNDDGLDRFYKTWTIILSVLSWLFSPVIFNPFTTLSTLQKEFKEFTMWLSTIPTEEQIKLLAVVDGKQLNKVQKEELGRIPDLSWTGWWMQRYLKSWDEPRLVGFFQWRWRVGACLLTVRLLPWFVLIWVLIRQLDTLLPLVVLLALAVHVCVLDLVSLQAFLDSAAIKSDRGLLNTFFFFGLIGFGIATIWGGHWPTLLHAVVAVMILFCVEEVILLTAEVFMHIPFFKEENTRPGIKVLNFMARFSLVSILHKSVALFTVMLLFVIGSVCATFPSFHTTLLYNEAMSRTWNKVVNENPARARDEIHNVKDPRKIREFYTKSRRPVPRDSANNNMRLLHAGINARAGGGRGRAEFDSNPPVYRESNGGGNSLGVNKRKERDLLSTA